MLLVVQWTARIVTATGYAGKLQEARNAMQSKGKVSYKSKLREEIAAIKSNPRSTAKPREDMPSGKDECMSLLTKREEELATCQAMQVVNVGRARGSSAGEMVSGDLKESFPGNLLVESYGDSLTCAKAYGGEDVARCPCCGWCGGKTDLVEHTDGRSASCPVCGSEPRHRDGCERLGRNPALFVPRNLHSDRPFRLLHFEPFQQLRDTLATVGGMHQVLLSVRAKEHSHTSDVLGVNVANLRFPDKFADGAILQHALEDASEFDEALSEVARVLRPGSWVLISVPCDHTGDAATPDCSELSSGNADPDCAVQWFSCAEFRRRVEKNGFLCPRGEKEADSHVNLLQEIQQMCVRAK
eukprot:CAMPEP_0119121304 /NCGR_PEP_ID=MMETSP1310-20130426/2003_1 /TAXON_ID=464262 /ORGANISM="Genus nov. species nov., Strain RCC2339" /LENGTH=355 /DNA_ID=CAMNT_0007110867 /DNA_START=182 /DNA_END=1249 /DNA_ORIENTATION=+